MTKLISRRTSHNHPKDDGHLTDDSIIEIGYRGERFFSEEDANRLFPIINKLTKIRDFQIGNELYKLERLLPCDPRAHQICKKVAPSMIQWKRELEQLGCRVFDMENVGFFNGEGYYLGRPTDHRVRYIIAYGEQVTDKRAIARISTNHPY